MLLDMKFCSEDTYNLDFDINSVLFFFFNWSQFLVYKRK